MNEGIGESDICDELACRRNCSDQAILDGIAHEPVDHTARSGASAFRVSVELMHRSLISLNGNIDPSRQLTRAISVPDMTASQITAVMSQILTGTSFLWNFVVSEPKDAV